MALLHAIADSSSGISQISRDVGMADTNIGKAALQVEERFEDVPAEHLPHYRVFLAKDQQWRDEKTKALVRKVDYRLLPLLFTMWVLNFLDRSNLAQARLGTLEKDLGMKGTDFNLATSILFVVGNFRGQPLSMFGVRLCVRS